jgi:fatty acid desaturase
MSTLDSDTTIDPTADALGLDETALRREVIANIDRRPDAMYGAYHVAAGYVQLALLLAFVNFRPDGVGWWVPIILAMGWTQFRMYFTLHEACHNSLFPSRGANRIFGNLLSGTLFSAFSSFTTLHMAHHRLFGTQEDPGSVDYFVRFETRGEMLRFFLGPLFGFSILEKVKTNAWDLMFATVRGKSPSSPPIASGEEGKTSGPTPRGKTSEVVVLLLVQGAIFLAITGFAARPFDYLLGYLLPALTVFLFLQRLRMYVEHGPSDYAAADYLADNLRPIVRTHRTNPLERPLFSYMNFHYHWEHHLCPTIPAVHLREVHERFTRPHLDPDDRAGSFFATLRRIWRLPETRAKAS